MIKAEAKAFIQNIKLGPLSLTGLGCDMKAGTADDGACLWFKFNLPMRCTRACILARTHMYIECSHTVWKLRFGAWVLLVIDLYVINDLHVIND